MDTNEDLIKEDEVEGHIVNLAKKYGITTFKMAGIGKKGIPDRLVIGQGKAFFVETKRPIGGRLSLHQQHVKELFILNGLNWELITSKKAVEGFFAEEFKCDEVKLKRGKLEDEIVKAGLTESIDANTLIELAKFVECGSVSEREMVSTIEGRRGTVLRLLKLARELV